MASTTDIRQRIIEDVVATLDRSGVVKEARDETPTIEDFEKASAPTAWVFEGEEEQRSETTGYTTAFLTVVVQVVYPLRRQQELHKEGRAKLAQVQKTMQVDTRRGGWATRTDEAGNGFSELSANKPLVGVMTTAWLIQYDRNRNDPYSNS